MVVKFVNRRQVLISLVVIAIVSKSCVSIEECNVDLLKFFGLSPLKYPVNSSMIICGNVKENCCSMSDEIRIFRLWKRFSVSQITRYIDKLVKNYSTLFAYHEELLAVEFDKIEVKHTEYRKIPFKFKVCERIAHQLDEEEKILNTVDLLNNNYLLENSNFKNELLLKHRGIDNKKSSDLKNTNLSRLSAQSSSGKNLSGRVLESVLRHKAENSGVVPNRELRVVLNHKQSIDEESDNNKELNELDKQLQASLQLQSQFNHMVDKDGPSLNKNTQQNLQEISSPNVNNKDNTDSSQRNLKQAQESNQISQLSNFTPPKPSSEAFKEPEVKKAKKKRNLHEQSESQFSRPFLFEEELPERKVQCTYLDREVNKRLTVVNKYKHEFCYNLKEKLSKFKIKDFRAYLPDVKVEMIRLTNLKKSFYCYLCDIEKQKLLDSTNSIATFDVHFCRRLVIDFRDYLKFQNVLLIEYIDMILQYVRCFQTTADEARFPYASFLSMYQKNFEVIQNCYDNIDKPDFMKHCINICQQYSYTTFSKFFDGNPDLINRILMTLTSFFRKLRANKALTVDYKTLKREFEYIDAVDFKMEVEDQEEMEHDDNDRELKTHLNASSQNNSDKKLLKRSNKQEQQKLIKHQNKHKRTLQGDQEYNLEASRISQMSKEQYHNYMIEKTYDQASPISWEKESDEGHSSIYESRASKPVTNTFRSRFVDDFNALDPLEVEPQLNFAINIKTLFKLQCDKQRKKSEKAEVLQREVINTYFSANDEDIHNFATDLFMPFTDYEFFDSGDKNVTKEKKVIL